MSSSPQKELATTMLRHALVTGASSGLGRELVRQLVHDRGMTVLATARRRDRLESLAAECPPGKVLIAPGDLADPSFRQELWARAEALPEGLDLLVNNAGLGHYAEFADQDPSMIRQILEVNVVALFDLTQKAARHMRARGGGQIVEVSSVLGFVGLPDSAAYVASKHAVNGLVKCLRYELRGSGVRVWAACPGRTESEFATRAQGRDPDADQARGPAPRGASTTQVVRAIVRGLDGRKAFLFPNAKAWAAVAVAHWLPGPFEWFMMRWSRRLTRAAGAFNRAVPGADPRSSAP
jgi:short-subunit dehydrogenase